MAKSFLIIGAVCGLLAVAIGAFGAHALRDSLDAYAKGIYDTAVQYQMFHATALLVVGLLLVARPELGLALSGWAFLLGIVLFSGSLYLLAVTGTKAWGAVTPFGGLSFLLGWAWLAYTVWKEL